MKELIDYRIEKHDQQIETIIEHNMQVSNSLIIVNEELKSISKNIEEILKRIKILEEDHRNRKIKIGLIRSLFNYWPALIAFIAIISAVDFSKIISFIKKY